MAANPMEILSGDELVAAQKTVAAAAITTGQAIANVDAGIGNAFSSIAGGNSVQQRFYATSQDIKYLLSNSVYPTAQEFASTGRISGKEVTRQQIANLLNVMGNSVMNYADALQYAKAYSSSSIFVNALLGFIADLTQIANDFFLAAKSILQGVAKTLKVGGGIIGWLPWIAGVLIIGPPLLSIFVAAKKGGATSAAAEAADQLKRGRDAAARGAKTVASTAAKVGAKAAFAGLNTERRRKVSRRRSRVRA